MWLFFGTQYNSSISSFVPNFRILTLVVAEKSLTEKKFTDRQTNMITERQKLYTPYILHTGGIPSYRGINNGAYQSHKMDVKGYTRRGSVVDCLT